ncbi:hypothetical protein SAY87_002863 [Trapa incisa]|uniref:NAC domain-containing protein n=1 Tax=Trapa incisa TaxID=236973 RepID=A0AAN7KRH6_9MYRT|nr:hypothetical protein SAY87_002863 [Trapa incisa]
MDANLTVSLPNGEVIRLPVGFRFHPSDEELLVHYLTRKVLSAPLPAVLIPELDVFHTVPWNLPGDLREIRHFFRKKKMRQCIRPPVAAVGDGSGYWKFSGKVKRILASGSSRVIGMKRSFTFHQGKSSHITKPKWIMHELHSVNHHQTTTEWAVYRVFMKRGKQPKGKNKTAPVTPTVIDLRNRNEAQNSSGVPSESAPPPPSPCSSSSSHDHQA